MTPWLDGLTVLVSEWRVTVPILLWTFTSQAFIGFFLRSIFGDRLAPSERLALALGGWTVLLLPFSLLWYFTGWDGLFWLLPPALIFFLFLRFRPDPLPARHIPGFFLLLFLVLSLPLRLAYASQTDLPLYFDSAQHYLIIKTLLLKSQTLLWDWLNASYYHLGFHFATAFLTAGSGAEIARLMLIFGQIILLLIPFPVFFIVRHETNSDTAGALALFLAAFGWYMPAHAVNWGKYPALMNLGMFAWLWGMMLVVFQPRTPFSTAQRAVLYAVWMGGAALAVLTHSRSLISLALILSASALAAWLERRSRKYTRAALFAATAIVAWLGWLVSRQSLLALTFDSYLYRNWHSTLLVSLLLLPAGREFPRLALAALLTIAGLLASLFLPAAFVPGYAHLTLLDRPFVQMILFLPLSLLGGVGLAGMMKRLQGRSFLRRTVLWLAVGGMLANALPAYDLYPSRCCMMAGRDDLAAMDWIAKRLPSSARIGIASTSLRILPNETFESEVGADAGVWITPLTGRETVLLPFHTNFGQSATLEFLCRAGLAYLFVGERGQAFDRSLLNAHPAWYHPLLSMPKTAVYAVTGCE